ncbi:MAG TPA: hypothetical protein VIO11_11565 [Candidatus Methanoperedens sp.]
MNLSKAISALLLTGIIAFIISAFLFMDFRAVTSETKIDLVLLMLRPMFRQSILESIYPIILTLETPTPLRIAGIINR